MNERWRTWCSLVIVLALAVAGCAPTVTGAVVEKEVTREVVVEVVRQVVVTATPWPTTTLLPSATPAPVESATFERWTRESMAAADVSGDALTESVALLEQVMTGAASPDDPAWAARFAAQTAKLRDVEATLRSLEAPEGYEEIHRLQVSAAGDMVLASEYTLKGSQQRDPVLLKEGTRYLESGSDKLRRATALLAATVAELVGN